MEKRKTINKINEITALKLHLDTVQLSIFLGMVEILQKWILEYHAASCLRPIYMVQYFCLRSSHATLLLTLPKSYMQLSSINIECGYDMLQHFKTCLKS